MPVVAARRARTACTRGALAACGLFALIAPWTDLPARAADTDWIDQTLIGPARQEGSLVVYSSINEEEGLALWKGFEQATGIKVEYVRGSDVQMIARVLIEGRSGRKTWDVMQTPGVHKLPPQLLAQVDLPEAKHGLPEARDPNRRWQGVAAIYQAPGYNTKLVDAGTLPKTHEELAQRGAWAGHVAINDNDSEWIASLLQFYGEDKGRALIKSMADTLKPTMVSGHLALARAVAAGEYWVALSNYAHLTTNVKLRGGPTNFFALDPVGVFFNEVGVAQQAPHPNAARIAANYLLSKPAQQQLTRRGRVPIRLDVETNPPGMLKPLLARKLAPVVLSAEQEKTAAALFKELIGGRSR
jgi:iron(III) transport system substrate-binding protein